jgi:hypothetical protein
MGENLTGFSVIILRVWDVAPVTIRIKRKAKERWKMTKKTACYIAQHSMPKE